MSDVTGLNRLLNHMSRIKRASDSDFDLEYMKANNISGEVPEKVQEKIDSGELSKTESYILGKDKILHRIPAYQSENEVYTLINFTDEDGCEQTGLARITNAYGGTMSKTNQKPAGCVHITQKKKILPGYD